MFTRKKKILQNTAKRTITVQTSYGHIDIVNLKSVWVNSYLGTYRLMYQDEIYEYNCIYWSDKKTSVEGYCKLKQKLIDAYNRGDVFVEL